MTPLTVASRFLEPLSHPWAVVTAAVVPLDTTVWEGAQAILRLSFRLLHLLLAL
ncbi:MAG: hypothetical protein HRF46_05310 [Acidobacteriota bacterium]